VTPAGGVRLLERDAELAALGSYWAEALVGRGRFVFLRGEGGAGKTSVGLESADGGRSRQIPGRRLWGGGDTAGIAKPTATRSLSRRCWPPAARPFRQRFATRWPCGPHGCHRIGFGVDRRRSRAPGGGAAVSADRVLFDEPGPHGRRRIRVLTVLSTVVIAAVIAVAVQRFAANGQLTAEKWKPFTLPYVQKLLWDGLQSTLQITAVSGVLALPLGVVFALLQLSHRPAIRWIATSYIEIAIQVYVVISLIYIVINLAGDVDGDRSWRPFAAL